MLFPLCTWFPPNSKANNCPFSPHWPCTVPILTVTFQSCGFDIRDAGCIPEQQRALIPTTFALSLISKDFFFLSLCRRSRTTLPKDSLASDLEMIKQGVSLEVKPLASVWDHWGPNHCFAPSFMGIFGQVTSSLQAPVPSSVREEWK